MTANLEELSLAELKNLAKEKGIKGITGLKKAELAEKLAQLNKEEEKPAQPEHTQEESEDKHRQPKQMLFDVNKTKENVHGILEVLDEGYGFARGANCLDGTSDIYVPPAMIRKYYLKTGDKISGYAVNKDEKFDALVYITSVNGERPDVIRQRTPFENLTPIYPDERLKLECSGKDYAMRLIDIMAPIGKGQRGLIVAPPKTGKTTILKQIAKNMLANNKDIHLIILLIDERPEEVTDMKYSVEGAEIVYSTFDMEPKNHAKVAEMVLARAQRLVECGQDVVILLDSITRLARAYNLTVEASGRSLSGGIDAGALYKPKKFFGAARNIEKGGSLTIIATALIETGSRMDDVIFEEFKGTGNMELHLDRTMSERRIFPAVDIFKSGTRKDNLLLSYEELSAAYNIRRAFGGFANTEVTEYVLQKLVNTRNNEEFVNIINKEIKYEKFSVRRGREDFR